MRELDAVQTWSDPRYGLGYGPGYGSGCNPGKMLIDAASSFAYLEVLIEHSPIAIAVLDGEHRFRLCNPAFGKLFQYRPEELASCALDSLIAAPDYLLEASRMSREVLAGKKVHTVTQRRRKDGTVLDVEIHGIPLIFDGAVQGVYGLYQDVTERNNALTACREMAHQLETIRQEERRRSARDLPSQKLAVPSLSHCPAGASSRGELRLLLADDHVLIRRGVRDLLKARPEWRVIAEAGDGTEAVRLASELQPDIAILGFRMPETPATIRAIRTKSPRTRIIVLTMPGAPEALRSVMEAGARGYVFKRDADEDLVRAVEQVRDGRRFFDRRAAEGGASGFMTDPTPANEVRTRLTPRETEVLTLLAGGSTSKEVGAQLKISARTAEAHRININRKFNFKSLAELMRYAISQGLVASVW